MSTSVDDHTEKRVEEVQIAGGSIHGSETQLDDDCVSENSYGSDFGDNATNEENITADIVVNSSLPAYSDEEYPQPDDTDVRSPSVDLTVVPHNTPPTRSTRPTFNAKSTGPSMCVVGGLNFNLNPLLISIN